MCINPDGENVGWFIVSDKSKMPRLVVSNNVSCNYPLLILIAWWLGNTCVQMMRASSISAYEILIWLELPPTRDLKHDCVVWGGKWHQFFHSSGDLYPVSISSCATQASVSPSVPIFQMSITGTVYGGLAQSLVLKATLELPFKLADSLYIFFIVVELFLPYSDTPTLKMPCYNCDQHRTIGFCCRKELRLVRAEFNLLGIGKIDLSCLIFITTL